jgi:hypothetical protein
MTDYTEKGRQANPRATPRARAEPEGSRYLRLHVVFALTGPTPGEDLARTPGPALAAKTVTSVLKRHADHAFNVARSSHQRGFSVRSHGDGRDGAHLDDLLSALFLPPRGRPSPAMA